MCTGRLALARDCCSRYGADGREFVFKTKSGDVLQLRAKPQREQEQHQLSDGEDDVHGAAPPSRRAAGQHDIGGGSTSGVSAAPALARSASYQAQSSGSLGPRRLERSATFHPANAEGGGADDVREELGLGGLGGGDEQARGDDDASGARVELAVTASVKPWEDSQQSVDADSWVDFLMSHVPACAELQPTALAKVLKSARAFVLDAGGTLVKENETPSGQAIWIVLDGMLQVTRTAVKFASAQQQLVQRVVRKKACIDPSPMPRDAARVFHTGITVPALALAIRMKVAKQHCCYNIILPTSSSFSSSSTTTTSSSSNPNSAPRTETITVTTAPCPGPPSHASAGLCRGSSFHSGKGRRRQRAARAVSLQHHRVSATADHERQPSAPFETGKCC
jgi:hypothetical protein